MFAIASLCLAFVAQGRRSKYGIVGVPDSSARFEKLYSNDQHKRYHRMNRMNSLATLMFATWGRAGVAGRPAIIPATVSNRFGNKRQTAAMRLGASDLYNLDESFFSEKKKLRRLGFGRALSSDALMADTSVIPDKRSKKKIPIPKVSDWFIVVAVWFLVRRLRKVSGQLLAAFLLGGLFFSTIVAAFGAFYTFGAGNSRRAYVLFTQVVRRVWAVGIAMLGATLTVLLDPSQYDTDGDKGTSRWTAAATIVRDGIARARQAAAEGVEAIKAERNFYAAAIGAPGLVLSQYVIRRLTPFVLEGLLRNSLNETLSEAEYPNVQSLHLKEFDVGDKAPELKAARLYDLGRNHMAVDVDVEWKSSCVAQIDMQTKVGPVSARNPVVVRNVRFNGPMRFVVTNLTTELPGYGALLFSLPRAPEIGFDVNVAGGEVTRFPLFRLELEKSIQKELKNQVLWPRRMIIPAQLPPELETPFVLNSHDLESLTEDDPLLRAERELSEQPVLKEGLRAPNATENGLKNMFNITFMRLASGANITGGTINLKRINEGWRHNWKNATRGVWNTITFKKRRSSDSNNSSRVKEESSVASHNATSGFWRNATRSAWRTVTFAGLRESNTRNDSDTSDDYFTIDDNNNTVDGVDENEFVGFLSNVWRTLTFSGSRDSDTHNDSRTIDDNLSDVVDKNETFGLFGNVWRTLTFAGRDSETSNDSRTIDVAPIEFGNETLRALENLTSLAISESLDIFENLEYLRENVTQSVAQGALETLASAEKGALETLASAENVTQSVTQSALETLASAENVTQSVRQSALEALAALQTLNPDTRNASESQLTNSTGQMPRIVDKGAVNTSSTVAGREAPIFDESAFKVVASKKGVNTSSLWRWKSRVPRRLRSLSTSANRTQRLWKKVSLSSWRATRNYSSATPVGETPDLWESGINTISEWEKASLAASPKVDTRNDHREHQDTSKEPINKTVNLSKRYKPSNVMHPAKKSLFEAMASTRIANASNKTVVTAIKI